MKISDRYLLKGFIKSFIISLLGFVAVYIIVDVFEHMAKFVDYGASFFSIVKYYFYQIPWIIGYTVSPIACILGCFISIGNFSRHLEIAVLRFSGVSVYRLILPFVYFGIILSTCILCMNEFLVPILNEKKEYVEKYEIRKIGKVDRLSANDVYYNGEGNKFYHINFVDATKSTVYKITIYEFNEDGKLAKRTDATKGIYKNKKWQFFNGNIRYFGEDFLKTIYFDTLSIKLNETLNEFIKEEKAPLSMNFFEFKNYIEKMKRCGKDTIKEMVDLYLRISFPFMNLIVIFLGLPLAIKVRNIGFIVGFGVSLFVSFLYWGISQLFKALGQIGTLSPFLVSILPNVFFLIVGLILLFYVRK